MGRVLEECGLEIPLSEGREPASLASFPAAECSPRLQCGGEKGVAEGFWGDNWAAIKCSQRSYGCCLCLSPVTGLLCSWLLKTPGGGGRAPCDLSPQWGSEQCLGVSGLDGLPSMEIGNAVVRGSEHFSLGNFSICAQSPLRTVGGGSWSLATVQLVDTLALSSLLILSFPTLGGCPPASVWVQRD